MKLVAIVRPPKRPDEAARAVADAGGLTLAEARMRLAPEPPALLARLEADKAHDLVAALRRAGLAALSVDIHCPSDKDRTVAHTMALDGSGVTFQPRFGDSMRVEWTGVLAILRGSRALRSEVERTEKVSLANAYMTGGLILTRMAKMTATRMAKMTARSSEEADEQVLLVYARDGRAASLSENHLDFSCLGMDKQPSSTGNMVQIVRLLRERAKGAFYDERLLRLGRRPLPFLVRGESHSQTPTTVTTRTDTSASLDTLAEVMRQALLESLLP
jgi:hypothetical protein